VLTDNEMEISYQSFLRIAVEDMFPDEYSIGPLVEAKIFTMMPVPPRPARTTGKHLNVGNGNSILRQGSGRV
jgi:hypothetical protein